MDKKGNKKNMILDGNGSITLGVCFDDDMCQFGSKIKINGLFSLHFADIPKEESEIETGNVLTRGRYRGCW